MKYFGFCKFGLMCAFKHTLTSTPVPNLINNEVLEKINKEKSELQKKINLLEELVKKKDLEILALTNEVRNRRS